MLSLESPHWNELKANGDACQIPPLIQRLQHAASIDEFRPLWLSLWEYIYHQYDVFPASYAALPYLVDLLPSLPPEELPFFAGSIGMIAALAHRWDAECIPPELQQDYAASLQKAGDLFHTHLRTPGWSEQDYTLICGALAAVLGYPVLAINLLDVILQPEELFCPNCETFFPTFGHQIIKGVKK